MRVGGQREGGPGIQCRSIWLIALFVSTGSPPYLLSPRLKTVFYPLRRQNLCSVLWVAVRGCLPSVLLPDQRSPSHSLPVAAWLLGLSESATVHPAAFQLPAF